MTLANSTLVPEFQYYFRQFVLSSSINKNQIPLPTSIDSIFLTAGSVVELLCSETFPYDSYKYLYENVASKGSWPAVAVRRLMIYPSSAYLKPSDDGVNFFSLQTDDLKMLNVLLYYRHSNTSVQLIDTTGDSTSILIIEDSTAGTVIVQGNINGLSTPLSKLIFLYLDLHINGNYTTYYQLQDIVSDCSMLATCFELKLIDDYFDFISSMNSSLGINCPVT